VFSSPSWLLGCALGLVHGVAQSTVISIFFTVALPIIASLLLVVFALSIG